MTIMEFRLGIYVQTTGNGVEFGHPSKHFNPILIACDRNFPQVSLVLTNSQPPYSAAKACLIQVEVRLT